MSAAEAMEWGRDREMNATEALSWRIEADPRLRSTITAVEVFDRVPDWDRLVAAHEWATRVVPRFRQRVIEPALGLGNPEWVVDPDFDLSYHVRRMSLPAPGSMRQLLDLAQQLAITPFDRTRPPWEAVLVEGLEGGRAGFVLKLHHSATDGLGGIQLLSMMHSRSREPSADKPQPDAPAAESNDRTRVLLNQLVRRAQAAPGQVRGRTGRTAALALRALRDPSKATSEAVHLARSFERVMGTPPSAPSPLLSGRSRAWRFDTHELPLAELKTAAKSAGGSLNDAFLAAISGAFRIYHERLGQPVETMPFAFPISLRTGDHPMGGNHFAGARMAAPIGVADAAERIRIIREFVLTARDEPAIDALNVLAPALAGVPTTLLTQLVLPFTASNDVQASNVPGIAHPVFFAGARITHMFPFGPLPGCAAMITMVTHNGTCCLGINTDPAAVTDPDLFLSCLRAGFDEVLALTTDKATSPTTG